MVTSKLPLLSLWKKVTAPEKFSNKWKKGFIYSAKFQYKLSMKLFFCKTVKAVQHTELKREHLKMVTLCGIICVIGQVGIYICGI